MPKYLVEEVQGDTFDNQITRRFLVDAVSPQEAMWRAGSGVGPIPEVRELADDEDELPAWADYIFAFGPQDLEQAEGNEGYMWYAYDGSSIGYEVRNLDAAMSVL